MRLAAALCVLTTFFLQPTARAQTEYEKEVLCPPKPVDVSRTVNGHAFLPFLDLPWPFVTTRVGSVTGMGVLQLESIPVVNGPDLNQEAKLVAFTQSFAADFLLTRYLGLNTGFGFGNAVGINQAGAFNLGINYAFGATAGLVARLAHGERWYLSLRADIVAQRAEAVLPAALADDVTITNGQPMFSLGSLTRGGNILRPSADLMIAYSPIPIVGLQGSVGVDVVRIEVGSQTAHSEYLNLGLGSSVRFNPFGVPIALLVGGSVKFRLEEDQRVYFATIDTDQKVTGLIEPALYYSEPKYIDVGLSAAFQVASAENRRQVRIVLNHFW